MTSAIIDFQERKSKLLEFTVLDFDTLSLQNWSVKSRKHGLYNDWCNNVSSPYDGEIEFEQIYDIIKKVTERFKFIFADGYEKCKFIQDNILTSRIVFNLQDFGCPTASDINVTSTPCLMHHDYLESQICSMFNAQKLGNWCKANKLKVNLMDSLPRFETFKGWKNFKVNPHRLANSGFIFCPLEGDEESDHCQCVYCGTIIADWKQEVHPLSEHQKLSPNCTIFNKLCLYNDRYFDVSNNWK